MLREISRERDGQRQERDRDKRETERKREHIPGIYGARPRKCQVAPGPAAAPAPASAAPCPGCARAPRTARRTAPPAPGTRRGAPPAGAPARRARSTAPATAASPSPRTSIYKIRDNDRRTMWYGKVRGDTANDFYFFNCRGPYRYLRPGLQDTDRRLGDLTLTFFRKGRQTD